MDSDDYALSIALLEEISAHRFPILICLESYIVEYLREAMTGLRVLLHFIVRINKLVNSVHYQS